MTVFVVSLSVLVQTELVLEAAWTEGAAVGLRAVALLVAAKGFDGSESFGAERAAVRPLPSVTPSVHLQLRAVAEALAADLAQHRPLARVPDQVQAQSHVAPVRARTEAAAEWRLLSVVSEHVPAALGLTAEAQSARRAAERPPAAVRGRVQCQAPLRAAHHPALGAEKPARPALDYFKFQRGIVLSENLTGQGLHLLLFDVDLEMLVGGFEGFEAILTDGAAVVVFMGFHVLSERHLVVVFFATVSALVLHARMRVQMHFISSFMFELLPAL